MLGARLALGDHLTVAVDLERVTREHPYREELRALQMLALYRSGRQADALRVFQAMRSALAEELGIDPSPRLRRLEEQILLQDPDLDPPAASRHADGGGVGARREPLHGAPRVPGVGCRTLLRPGAADRPARRAGCRARPPSPRWSDRAGPASRASCRRGSSRRFAVTSPNTRDRDAPAWFAALRRARGGAGEPGRGRPPREPHGPAGDRHGTAGRGGPSARHRRGAVSCSWSTSSRSCSPSRTPTRPRRSSPRSSEAADDAGRRIHVLLTMRADFYDRPLADPRFGRLFADNVVTVIPMGPDELEAAATLPAQQLDVRIEPRLMARLIADVAGQPNALPLFQYALTELFDERAGSILDLATYERVGGVRKAVARRAESLYSRLDGPEQEAVRQLFLRIATVSDTVVGRRRVPASELTALDVDIVALQGAIDSFARYRLLALDRDPTTGAPTVEVAHEALLGEWHRLRDWIDESRDDLATHARFAVAVQEWETAGREPGYLLTGSRLDDYERWAATSRLKLTVTEQAFILESVAAARPRASTTSSARPPTARQRRRSRWQLATLFGATAVLAGIIAYPIVAADDPPAQIAVALDGRRDERRVQRDHRPRRRVGGRGARPRGGDPRTAVRGCGGDRGRRWPPMPTSSSAPTSCGSPWSRRPVTTRTRRSCSSTTPTHRRSTTGWPSPTPTRRARSSWAQRPPSSRPPVASGTSAPTRAHGSSSSSEPASSRAPRPCARTSRSSRRSSPTRRTAGTRNRSERARSPSGCTRRRMSTSSSPPPASRGRV